MTINNYILSTVGEERPDPMNYFGVESVYISSFFRRSLWSTLSNALAKSRYIASESVSFPRDSSISSK